jgi:hypothetical protein
MVATNGAPDFFRSHPMPGLFPRRGENGKSKLRDGKPSERCAISSTTQRYVHLDDRELADSQGLVE